METTCTSRHRRKTILHRRSKNKYDNSELIACTWNRDVSLGKPEINGEDSTITTMQMTYSVTQNTRFTKAFFTLTMSFGFKKYA
jgi:hypothetical protein